MFTSLIARTLSSTISLESDEFQVILIEGMPQCGKTTLAQSLFRNLPYIDLSDVHPRNLAQTNPSAFFPVYGKQLVLDEIHLVPELIEALPAPDPDLKIILIGNLPQTIREGILAKYPSKRYVLTPFSQKEYVGGSADLFGQNPIALTMTYPRPGFFDSLRNGFLPRADLQLSNHAFYEGWLGDFFFNVVRPVMKVAKEVEFLNFMKAIARANMQELNHFKLAEESGISYGTAMYWADFLLEAHIIMEVPSLQLAQRRQVKRPKVTYTDSGLLCHLLQIHDTPALLSSPAYLSILEGNVASEIAKGYRAWGEELPLFFYRDTAKKHIELVLKTKTGLLPIGFLSARARSITESLRHMRVLERMGENTREPVFISDGTLVLPATDYPVISAAML